jgi:hypothetical protein
MERRQPSKRQLCFVLLLLLTVVALPVAAVKPAADGQPRCEVLKQWALENLDLLPRDYAGLLAYPMDERRAIFGTLTPEQKAAFLSDRVAHYVRENPRLSAQQKKTIDEGLAVFSPALYAVMAQGESPRTASFEKLIDQKMEYVKLGLGDAMTNEIFFRLGPVNGTEKHSVPTTDSVDCDCRLNQCTGGAFCDTASGCTQVPGCGPGGTALCRGICSFP